MGDGKGLAVAALVLGILGLFTAGGLVGGSLLGLVLAGAALTRGTPSAGRDVAWAALAANLFALITVVPIGAAAYVIRSSPIGLWERDDESLPEPARAEQAFVVPDAGFPPPPPPPAPATIPRAAAHPTPARVAEDTPAESAAAPVRIGGAIPEPRKIRSVSPVYPALAVQARVQGVVVLECTISPRGRVVEVRPVSGPPLLRDAAVEAVRQWEYTPTLVNGVAVPVLMRVTVNFKLS